MKWGESRTVTMKSIVGPGDLPDRMKAPHVVQLAASTKRFGGRPGNRPWVMKVRDGWKLIAGRDRYAAQTLNGEKQMPVEVVLEATPDELRALERHENLHRRVDDRDKLIAEEVAAESKRIASERASSVTNVPKPPGRPKTPEGEARASVAAKLGTTPAAVKQAVARVEKREGAPSGNRDTAQAAPAAPPIDPFEKVEKLLRQAYGTIKGAEGQHAADVRKRIMAALDELLREGAEFGTPEWHRETAAMHADGPCGCASCEFVTGEIQKALVEGAAQAMTMGKAPKLAGLAAVAAGAQATGTGIFESVDRDGAKSVVAARAEESDDPEPGDCAHAYRKGGVSTGVCLNCGAPGAATWTEAQHVPKGTKAPPHEPDDAGWTAHGPGSDRKRDVKPAKADPGARVAAQAMERVDDIDRHIARAAVAVAPGPCRHEWAVPEGDAILNGPICKRCGEPKNKPAKATKPRKEIQVNGRPLSEFEVDDAEDFGL